MQNNYLCKLTVLIMCSKKDTYLQIFKARLKYRDIFPKLLYLYSSYHFYGECEPLSLISMKKLMPQSEPHKCAELAVLRF